MAHYACWMDLDLYRALNGFALGHDGFEDPVRFLAVNGPVIFIALLASLYLARGKWRSINGRHGVVAAGFSALLALGIAHIVTELWARPRPYAAHPSDVHLFVPASHDPSFPSDHATAAFAIAVAILLRHRKGGIVALALAVLVSLSRVVVGVHYPSDVPGGAAVGTLAALILWHPSVRGPLHALADWSARVYERLVPVGAGATARGPG